MCGICGFTHADQTNHAAEHDRDILARMCDVMAHRGPDGEGYYVDDGIALGHRRLALVDLCSGGQPMVRLTSAPDSTTISTDDMRGDAPHAGPGAHTRGDYALVFNGEIYNHRSLAARLTAEGWKLDTRSDTEVVLVGYLAWGPARLLELLEGMFAFALWDGPRHELFCARDPFGIKPFYYATVNGQFVFASEIKAILEHPGYERRLNRDALAHYLCFQFNPLDETFFEGIYKLGAGHSLTVGRTGACQLARYWEPRFSAQGERLSEHAATQAIDDAMRHSVQRHGDADVEVGSLLSGGIDSSYVCGCHTSKERPTKTFTVGFSEYAREKGRRDEVGWARGIAERLSIEGSYRRIERDEYLSAAPRVQWHMDEPLGDPSAIPLFFVNQLASSRVKAVLSGEGADELFGGYRVYAAPALAARLAFAPKGLLSGAAKALRRMGLRGSGYLERAAQGTSRWYYTNANGKAFTCEERTRILKDGARGAEPPQDLVRPLYDKARRLGLDDPTSMQLVDMSCWLVNDILLKADKMSMAHSVESRVPYLDKHVFAVANELPTPMKVSRTQTKRALRAASLSVLPTEWAYRDKLGFPVPLAEWLRHEDVAREVRRWFASAEARELFHVDELARLVDDHCAGKDLSRRIWIIWMFLVWHRIYFVDRRQPELP